MKTFASAIREIAKSAAKDNMKEAVLKWLKDNPNPPDSKVHAFAEKNNYEVDDVEEALYELATKFMKFWTGGRSNKVGVTEKDVDPEQLKMGIKVEYEHTDNEDEVSTEIAKRIALDHLAEGNKPSENKYYTGLKKMEKEMVIESN